MRLDIIRNIVTVLFALVAAGLFYLQVIRGGYFYRQSENNAIRVIPFEGRRGLIMDRNGKILVENAKSFCVALIPQDQKGQKEQKEQKERADVFRFLGGVLNVDPEGLRARYQANRLAPFSPVVLASDITRPQAIMVEENTYRFPGLFVMEEYRRRYPFNEAGAHVLGYIGKPDESKLREIQSYGYSPNEPVGYSGVEEFYDNDLRAQPGGRQVQVDSRGRQVRILSVREPEEGRTLVLTVDQDFQVAAQRALAGRRGAVVMLDPANGEIIALVSSPTYDPNSFAERDDRSRATAYVRDSAAPLLDRAVGAQFPPGSVFKVAVTAAGLQERKVKPTTTYDCPGYFNLGGHRFNFSHAWGPQDLVQAMAHSANEYFFHIGLALGADQIGHYAGLFGLGERTGVDLPYEVKGAVPRRVAFARWYPGDTANMSIGQGTVLATPLQLARLMAVVETRGRLVTPHLKKSLGGIENNAPFASNRMVALRPEVWDTIKHALRAVVKTDNGTARSLDLPGIEVYGKTGTAQAGAGKADHAWFAGVFKTSKRVLAFTVLLEHGGSSANACLAARDMLLSLQSQGLI